MFYSAGVIVEKQDFFADSESWKGWAIKVLVTKPLEWTFNTFKSNIFGKDDRKQIEYIHLPVIKVN